MDFGPLFITAGIAQAARDDVGFQRSSSAFAGTSSATGAISAPRIYSSTRRRSGLAPGSWVRIPRSRAGRSGSSLKQQMTTARELPRPSFSLTSIETGVQL